jgi:hypothetical protein
VSHFAGFTESTLAAGALVRSAWVRGATRNNRDPATIITSAVVTETDGRNRQHIDLSGGGFCIRQNQRGPR